MQNDLQSLLSHEAALTAALEQFKTDTAAEISELPPLDGVQPSDNNGIRCITVSFSAIAKAKVLSAEYYDTHAQARAVTNAVKTCKTIADFIERINEILKTKKAGTTPLNENTLAYLRSVIEE